MKWCVKILLAAGVFAFVVGCGFDRQRLQKERADLQRQRNYLQGELDQHPVGSKWATHPDAMKIMDARETTDQRIREIDDRLWG